MNSWSNSYLLSFERHFELVLQTKTRCIIRYIRSVFIHPLSSRINGILFFQMYFESFSLSFSQLERIDADLAIPIAEIKRDIWP